MHRNKYIERKNYFVIRIFSKHGQFDAKVDSDMFEEIKLHQWHINQRRKNARYRAGTLVAGKVVYMHQMIMNAKGIDHINGDPLDNRKENLRLCSCSENRCNVPALKNNKTGFKGIYPVKGTSRFRAEIVKNGVRYNLGNYGSAENAAQVYNIAARELHGEFAYLNKL